MGEIRQLVISRALRRMRHGWVLTRGIGNQRQELRSGCHCWLVQQCGAKRRYALLDEPAVAPDTFFYFAERHGVRSLQRSATRGYSSQADFSSHTSSDATVGFVPLAVNVRLALPSGGRKQEERLTLPCSPNTSIEVRSSTICTCNVLPTTSNGALAVHERERLLLHVVGERCCGASGSPGPGRPGESPRGCRPDRPQCPPAGFSWALIGPLQWCCWPCNVSSSLIGCLE